MSGDKEALFHWLPCSPTTTIARSYSWVKKAFFFTSSALLSALNHPATGFCSAKARLTWIPWEKVVGGKVREMPWDNFLSPLRSFRSTSSSYEKKKKRQRKKEVKFNEIKSVCLCYWFFWKEKAWFIIQPDFSTDNENRPNLTFGENWNEIESKMFLNCFGISISIAVTDS